MEGVSSGRGAGSQQTEGAWASDRSEPRSLATPASLGLSHPASRRRNPELGWELGNEIGPRLSLLEALGGGGRGPMPATPVRGCYDPNGVTQVPCSGTTRTGCVSAAVSLSGRSFVCVM